jgi:hypothetical protein
VVGLGSSSLSFVRGYCAKRADDGGMKAVMTTLFDVARTRLQCIPVCRLARAPDKPAAHVVTIAAAMITGFLMWLIPQSLPTFRFGAHGHVHVT